MKTNNLQANSIFRKTFATFALIIGFGIFVQAQFPKLPKFDKPKMPKTDQTAPKTADVTNTSSNTSTSTAPQSTEPHLLKRTVQIVPRRFLRYWKNPTAAEPVYNTWSWSPEIKFAVNGPIESGSQLTVEFDTADGKPWFTQRMATPTLAADRWDDVSTVQDLNFDALEKKAITAQTGLSPYRIRLKNELNGTDKILFSGKYKITTYAPNQMIPEYKGKKEFYSDEDWRLPMAWLWINPQNNEDAPILCLQTWFKNSDTGDKIDAFLYYNGKQIATTGSGSPEQVLTNGVDEKQNRYSMRMFYFSNVRGFDKSSYGAYKESFFLDKNPGEYEIKIIRNGELSRSLKFSVGADRKIKDNGVVSQNKIGGIRMLMPIQIIGTLDGTWNKSAWQSESFYGNPLTGFTAVQ